LLELAGLDAPHLGWFVAAGLLLNLTPGPDVLYIVTQSLRRGARVGVVAGLGITAGCFVHVAAAAVGLGALLASSSLAFSLLKWLGAAYLLWMGLRMLLGRQAAAQPLPAAPVDEQGLKGVFLGGFLTNLLNPKVALFFLAFVPQFIAPDAPNKALAFVLLGTLFNLNSVAVNVAYALLAAALARRMAAVQRSMHAMERIAGLMFIGFGLRLALTDQSPS
jgi:RhtB (resistance to homoserine/threonine) family protein